MSVASRGTLRLVEGAVGKLGSLGSQAHAWLTPPRGYKHRPTPRFPHSCFGTQSDRISLLSLIFPPASRALLQPSRIVPTAASQLLDFTSIFVINFIIMPSEKTVTKASEARRSSKPIMEKRRRARINSSLTELKNLILDALKKDNARHSKLEKADILEMTVKHLQNLQLQQQLHPDPSHMGKYRAGFAECANEVNRFMGRMEGVDPAIRQRLLNHLANCLTGMNTPATTAPLPPVHVQVSESAEPRFHMQGLQLVPTRLPSGDIAFLLPANLSVYAPSASPASSTSSVTSPMSTTSSPGPVNVLGSAGILSPASSDRCSPSPVMMPPQSTHCPVIVQPGCYQPKPVQSKSVWRPF